MYLREDLKMYWRTWRGVFNDKSSLREINERRDWGKEKDSPKDGAVSHLKIEVEVEFELRICQGCEYV